MSRLLDAQSAIHENIVQVGSAVSTAEINMNKLRKYEDISAGVDIKTSRILDVQALELVSEIGRRLASTTH